MTVNTNEEVRAAIASLLRIGEPGDGLLKNASSTTSDRSPRTRSRHRRRPR